MEAEFRCWDLPWGWLKGHEYDSYLRLSTAGKQLDGYGKERQELGRQWVEAPPPFGLGLKHDTAFEDIGRSGFRGANRKYGQLGAYLKLVQDGKVKKGKVFVLEAFHRFGREDEDTAFENFKAILNAGIIVATTTDQKIYNLQVAKERSDAMDYVRAQMRAAHQESKFRSDFKKATYANKRKIMEQTGEPVTAGFKAAWVKPKKEGVVPGHPWIDADPKLQRDDSGQLTRRPHRWFWVHEEMVTALRLIFDLIEQNKSGDDIADELNRRGIKPFRADFHRRVPRQTRWRRNTVLNLAKFEAVTGKFQPHTMIRGQWVKGERQDDRRVPGGQPRDNYYPTIITVEQFLRVQAILARRANGPQTHIRRNLIGGGLTHCEQCNQSMTTDGDPGKGWYYMRCLNPDCANDEGFPLHVLDNMVFAVVEWLAERDDNPRAAAKLEFERLQKERDGMKVMRERKAAQRLTPQVVAEVDAIDVISSRLTSASRH